MPSNIHPPNAHKNKCDIKYKNDENKKKINRSETKLSLKIKYHRTEPRPAGGGQIWPGILPIKKII